MRWHTPVLGIQSITNGNGKKQEKHFFLFSGLLASRIWKSSSERHYHKHISELIIIMKFGLKMICIEMNIGLKMEIEMTFGLHMDIGIGL